MKYRKMNDSESPIVGLPDDLDENPIKEESRNDHDSFYGDGYDDRDDFEGK